MTAIDFNAIKPGDWVTARLKVHEGLNSAGRIVCESDEGQGLCLSESDIISHEPAPEAIKVGDWVTIRGGRIKYRVRAIVDNMALVQLWVATPDAVRVSDLTKTTPPA